jgi:FkbM family methyltransferase
LNEDLHVTVSRTEPPFLISTLNPLQDAWFALDVQKQGMWEVHSTQVMHHVFERMRQRPSVASATASAQQLVFVDVGANHGWFSLLAASVGWAVSAFEALPNVVREFRRSVLLNALDDSVKIHLAIATTDSRKSLWVHPFVLGPSPTAYVTKAPRNKDTIPGAPARSVEIPSIRVDDGIGLHGHSLSAVGVIKVDVEGCEIDAFRSASKVFEHARPEVFLEVCPSLLKRCETTREDEREVWRLLLRLKYTMLVYWHDARRPAVQLKAETRRIVHPYGRARFRC